MIIDNKAVDENANAVMKYISVLNNTIPEANDSINNLLKACLENLYVHGYNAGMKSALNMLQEKH